MWCARSSFNGVIDEIPAIAVDNFENTHSRDIRAYFLSHCHTDHTVGLFGNCSQLITTLERTKASIYMSKCTADIINYESSFDISHHVVSIEIGVPFTISLRADEKGDLEETFLEVTLIPAGHSLGSVMFLFKTQNVTVLYTGDFRLRPNDLPQMKLLNCNGQPIHIDTLYVDTTFQGAEYEHFPKRNESTEEVLAKLRQWLDEGNAVAIKQSAKFAYESFFNQIFDVLKEKVYVGDEKWQFYKNVQDSIPGTTNDSQSRIHLCCKNSFNHNFCNLMNRYKKFLNIKLCAWSFKNYEIEEKTAKDEKNEIKVCFATHCSQYELQCFIDYLSPKKVIGFPHAYKKFRVRFKVDEDEGKEFEVMKKKRKIVLK